MTLQSSDWFRPSLCTMKHKMLCYRRVTHIAEWPHCRVHYT